MSKLTNTDTDTDRTNNNIDEPADTSPVTDTSIKQVSLLDRFKPDTVYKSTNIFKQDEVLLYVFENGKFKPAYDKTDGIRYKPYKFKSKHNIKYLGHDTSTKFVHVHLYLYDQRDPKKFYDYWININDIKLKK